MVWSSCTITGKGYMCLIRTVKLDIRTISSICEEKRVQSSSITWSLGQRQPLVLPVNLQIVAVIEINKFEFWLTCSSPGTHVDSSSCGNRIFIHGGSHRWWSDGIRGSSGSRDRHNHSSGEKATRKIRLVFIMADWYCPYLVLHFISFICADQCARRTLETWTHLIKFVDIWF